MHGQQNIKKKYKISHSLRKQEVHYCVYKSLQSAVHFKEIRKLCSGEQKLNAEHCEDADLSTRNLFNQTIHFTTAAREEYTT